MAGDPSSHWDEVYQTKAESAVSWYQETPEPSLDLIMRTGAAPDCALVDIGGGASTLVDHLLDAGFQDLSVLDLSATALAKSKARLATTHSGLRAANRVQWIAGDVTLWEPQRIYDLWHDRAAFHFLTEDDDRLRYCRVMRAALHPSARIIIGTFALDGPEKCSGLPIQRYSSASLAACLGPDFHLIHSQDHEHVTPWGSVQRFQFSTFRFAA